MADSKLKIEKGIPLPESKGKWAEKYPWKDMDQGDSFLIPFGDEHKHLVRERASQAAAYAKRKYGFLMCTRTVADGIRIWRVE